MLLLLLLLLHRILEMLCRARHLYARLECPVMAEVDHEDGHVAQDTRERHAESQNGDAALHPVFYSNGA